MLFKPRSYLFIPSVTKMLQKIPKVVSDAIIPDLEDSVAPEHKVEALSLLADYLTREKETLEKLRIWPRLNHGETLEQEIQTLCVEGMPIEGIHIGKVETVDHVRRIQDLLEKQEVFHFLPKYTFKLIPTIESARGILNVKDIVEKADRKRMVGLCFGADDYAADLGFTRDTSQTDEIELRLARQNLCIAARAYELQCIDTPNVHFRDMEHNRKESSRMRRYGFTGKCCIHPDQVKIVNECFGVTKEEYEHAQSVVNQYQEAVNNKRGSLSINERMVDRPVLLQYRNVIRQYEMQQDLI